MRQNTLFVDFERIGRPVFQGLVLPYTPGRSALQNAVGL